MGEPMETLGCHSLYTLVFLVALVSHESQLNPDTLLMPESRSLFFFNGVLGCVIDPQLTEPRH